MAPDNADAVNTMVAKATACKNSPGAQMVLLFSCFCNMFALLYIVRACLQVSHTNTHPSSTHSFVNENMNLIVLFVITKLAWFDAFATVKHRAGADVAFGCQPQPQPQNITSLEPCKTITKPAQITRSFLEELRNLNYKTYRVAVEKAAWALQDQNTSVLI